MSSAVIIEATGLQRELLKLSREAARCILSGGNPATLARPQVPGTCGGVFVTFWRGDTLRGCVGTFVPPPDMATAVVETTRAALQDPRFASSPVTVEELAQLNIEISMLSVPQRTHEPATLVPGEHGVIVRRGLRSGCFLPRVATDRGWSAEEFLSNCCTMKARLPADSWRDSDTEVLTFTAQVFSEEELAVPEPEAR
jgi:hypothetical protein